MESSFSCWASTLEGASIVRQVAFCVFGNVMTSLMLPRPQSNIRRQSNPNNKEDRKSNITLNSLAKIRNGYKIINE